jgi:peroxiredoxin
MGILKIPHVTRPVEIQLEDVYGNTVRLSDSRGKVVFLNFWATWCAACVVEMPSMENLNGRLKDRDFVMVAINTQESDTQVKAFVEKMKLSFTALLDSNGEVAAGFAVNALPTTFVLDKEGRIVGTAIGPREWDSRASIALFEYLIDIRPEVKRET